MKKRRTSFLLAGALAMITLALYLPSLRNGFTGWDDEVWVLDNPHIRSLDVAFFQWAFFNFYRSNWCPLTWMSHAVDYALWGVSAAGHHVTNIILHALNTLIVVLLVIRLLEVRTRAGNTQGRNHSSDARTFLIAGGVTGILFGLHPVHVESVAWIAERKDVLCGLFFLLSVGAYIGAFGLNEPEPRLGRSNAPFPSKPYLWSLVFFILALLSKPMAVSLPLVLLILDWHPLDRMRTLQQAGRCFREKLPFVGFSAISSIITVLSQRSGGALDLMESTTLSTRLLVAADAIIAYLRKMAWPLDLMPYYPYPEQVSGLSAHYALSVALVILITAACVVVIKKTKLWLAAWGYYVITLLPVLGIVQVGAQSMADRYTYLPSLGPFLIAGLIAQAGVDKIKAAPARNVPAWILMGVIAGVLLIPLAVLTEKQIGIWKNGITLWSSVIEREQAPPPRVFMTRATFLFKNGQFEKAIDDYSRAIESNPAYSEAYHGRGQALKEVGKTLQAIADYSKAIALRPSYYIAYNSRGIALQELGRFTEAIEDYTRAIALKPDDYRIYNNRAVAFSATGRLDKAFEDYSSAIVLDPSSYTTYNNRCMVLQKMGQNLRAIEDCDRAIALNPGFAEAYLNRGNLYLGVGKKDLAEADFQKAAELGGKKDHAAVQRNRLK